MNFNWHPDCLRCHSCNLLLLDMGFVKNSNRPFCKECNLKEKQKSLNQTLCHKCNAPIENDMIRFKGDVYHAYHFNCKSCSIELNSNSRELRDELYCLKCHDKFDIPICAGCHTPIEERIVNALGKTWHVEHFACAKCEIPFNGSRHFEKRGLAYCETHYNQLFGNLCFVCNMIISGDVISFMNKTLCSEHFTCYLCDDLMSQKTKFYDMDSKPVCKHCFEKLPSKIRTGILKANESKDKEQTKSIFKWIKDK
ncbi:unnamed protein product [Brachionus calyciflorus]|uniref:LIM zinc-binding domain-containing protein n=1 Tax=Brachionus calyciflorus TaxID=104777 RepID=A0A814FCX7_9BILA|nr:unnamed protein product [Brachionus calyciflorus]